MCLGSACYKQCKYKLDNSAADLRVGDLWVPAIMITNKVSAR